MEKEPYSDRFRVVPGQKLRLDEIDPNGTDLHTGKAEALDEIQNYAERMRELQHLLYAEDRRSLLFVLQGMDTAGKDGTIRHVLGYMNPQGCRVIPFRVPTPEEAAHDFLWRAHRAAPARGQVAIFNRSHYEDVVIARVHELVPESVWRSRYDRIHEFERLLHEGGTHIIKFFLHISPEEQLQRLRRRVEDPHRQWKISESDFAERQYWSSYQTAYEEALQRCSTENAPWFVIPANHKWFRNLAVSRIVVERLETLNMQFPPPRVDLDAIRRTYLPALEGKKKS
jgi:PPK2 family polyphosphate:nucleotide phosphotransferase